MNLAKIVPIITLLLILSVTTVMATHTPQVSVQPSAWAMGTEQDVSLNVRNSGGDNIVIVELTVPEIDGEPLYLITEVSRPEGWTFDLTTRINQAHPYKITWTTGGSGIASDQTLGFGFRAQSPDDLGDYEWGLATIDSKNGIRTATLATSVTLSPVSHLTIQAPSRITAGTTFKVTVTAYDNFNNVKSDYTGTVSFSSSDAKAILPQAYTFTTLNNGRKTFSVKLKTAGQQTITVGDAQNTLTKTSSPITVEAGKFISLAVIPSALSTNPGGTVLFTAIANDAFDNRVDVTAETGWDIDDEAGGEWTDNAYRAENNGVWTVTGTHSGLKNAITLTVGGPPQPVIPVDVTEEIPIEETITPPSEPVEIDEPEAPIAALSLSGDDSIAIAAGQNDTMILTVNNEGDMDLTGVEIGFEGVPSDWILTFPLSSDIDAGDSKDYLVIIYVPEEETESQTITFTASSNEGPASEKEVELTLGSPATGLFEAIPRNILQLGVVIIAVAAVVIIGWELWFKK